MNQAIFQQIGVGPLLQRTAGHQVIKVGIVDGPVTLDHQQLSSRVSGITGAATAQCQQPHSHACKHGTFITGILAASRTSAVPGLCPDCSFVVRPLLSEYGHTVTPAQLAEAIIQTVDAGARILNLSLGTQHRQLSGYPQLQAAFDYAFKRGALMIAAAGNQGRVGHNPLFRHPWVIPVIACDGRGTPLPTADIPVSAAQQGVLAPGYQVKSLAPQSGMAVMTGSSMAAALVTGTAALLWSLKPKASAHQIRQALLGNRSRQRHLLPPVLNAQASWQRMNTYKKAREVR